MVAVPAVRISTMVLDDFTRIIADDVKAYLRYMQQRGLSKTTIEGRIKSIRVVSRVLNEAGILKENFAEAIKYRTKYCPEIIPFSDDPILLLLKNTAGKKPIELRMTVMIMLFLDNEMQLSEFQALHVGDVSFKHQKVFLRMTKNGGQQFMPFGKETSKALILYMKAFNIYSANLNAPLFQTETGKRWAKRSIEYDLRELGKKAGLQNVRCSPHTFRHTFALNALKNGVPELVLQRLLD